MIQPDLIDELWRRLADRPLNRANIDWCLHEMGRPDLSPLVHLAADPQDRTAVLSIVPSK